MPTQIGKGMSHSSPFHTLFCMGSDEKLWLNSIPHLHIQTDVWLGTCVKEKADRDLGKCHRINDQIICCCVLQQDISDI